ncbi:flagellar basal body rod protein FlgB [Thalassobacillus hwangdonensis]|uniref:Flagellar basal body rod protein FlgB n=1 Tax=Thalassobacillus hwangdonensis TaxID=546108 RepID=A0ABW3KXA3_9BACI
MNLFGGTIRTLEQSLDYSARKNKAISNNIANVDTPGYKAESVQFKEVFDSELGSGFEAKRTHERHLPFGTSEHMPYRVLKDRQTTYNHNGNNVDIDKEMNELAKNQIYYQAVVDRINGKFRSMQSVIKGGR